MFIINKFRQAFCYKRPAWYLFVCAYILSTHQARFLCRRLFLDLNFTQIKIKLRYFVSIQEKPQIAILNLHEF